MSGCDPDLIACQISTVAYAIGSWNWNSFFSTVIATAIGGLIGLVGVWWGFRLQRAHRYEEVLNDSIVEAIDSLVVYAEQAIEHEEKHFEYMIAEIGSTGAPKPVRPNVLTATVRLAVVRMRARGADQDLVSDAIESFHQIIDMPSFVTQGERAANLAEKLSEWRSGTPDAKQVRKEIRGLGLPETTEGVGGTANGS